MAAIYTLALGFINVRGQAVIKLTLENYKHINESNYIKFCSFL